MDRKTKRLIPALAGLLLALTLGACGWAEWPPPSRVQAVNAPPRAPHIAPAPRPQDPPQAAPVSRLAPVESVDTTDRSVDTVERSDPVFVGADSVTVGKGDTVYAISRRHKVSPRAIIEANDLRPPYRLAVGQRLKLPHESRHEVTAGDTLYSISRRYDIDMYTLAKANGIERPFTIVTGQELRIPAGGPAVRQVATARDDAEPDQPASTLVARTTPPPPPKPVAVSPPPSRKGGFIWPASGKIISRFGPKTKGLHNDGINISAPRGTEVKAAENGVVAYAGNEIRGFGNLLLIKHDGGWITAYAHNDEILVQRGQRIDRGQVIAKVGSSGNVTSPQLHFELRRGRNAVDPLVHLKRG